MKYSPGLLLITGILILSVMIAGCARMPEESTEISYSEEVVSDVSTPVPTEAIVTFSTSVPTETPEPRPTFTIPPPDINPEENYSIVYQDTVKYNYNVIPFDYIVDYPPMVFYYSATVPAVTDVKAGTSQFGKKDDYSYTYVSPNPLANYKITIYDKETNEVVYIYEIPRFSEEDQKGSFKIYERGDYHIEITGNLATVNTLIKVPPENIEEE